MNELSVSEISLQPKRLRVLVADDEIIYLRDFLFALREFCPISPIPDKLIIMPELVGDDRKEMPQIREHLKRNSLIDASYTSHGKTLIEHSKSLWDIIISDFKFEKTDWEEFFLAALFPFIYNAHNRDNIVIRIYSQHFTRLKENNLDIYKHQGEHVFEMVKSISGLSEEELMSERPKGVEEYTKLLRECLRERQRQILVNEHLNTWLLSKKIDELERLVSSQESANVSRFLNQDCGVLIENSKIKGNTGFLDMPILPYSIIEDSSIVITLPSNALEGNVESFWRVQYLFPQIAIHLYTFLKSEENDFNIIVEAINTFRNMLFARNVCVQIGNFWARKAENPYMFQITHPKEANKDKYVQYASLALHFYEKELEDALPEESAKLIKWWLTKVQSPALTGDLAKQKAMTALVYALFRGILDCIPNVTCENCTESFLNCPGFQWACRLERLLAWADDPCIPIECAAFDLQDFNCSQCDNKPDKPNICKKYIVPAIVYELELQPKVNNGAKNGAYFDVINFLEALRGIISGIRASSTENMDVKLDVWEKDTDLIITIEDNGTGFTVPLKEAFQRYEGQPGQELRDVSRRLRSWCWEVYVETKRIENIPELPVCEVYSIKQGREVEDDELYPIIKNNRKESPGTKYTLIIKRS